MDTKQFPELSVDSPIENFAVVKEWLQSIFDIIGCTGKPAKQLFIAVDEMFTNIAHYAYQDVGKVYFKASFNAEDKSLKISITDNGDKYNPLEKPDPDIAQRIKDKTVGGLGIFMTKKMVDNIEYSRVNESNVLVLTKKIN
jgi:anti-sigma regulatory factor (Ser/Thr protein kinase)